MIVDDMEIIRRRMKRLSLWKSSEFTIMEEAEDGQDALEKLLLQPVDLLITDISMPRINGIELLKETQERNLASCVVFLTEHCEFTFAKDAITYGVFDYLVKPVTEEGLGELLQKVCKHMDEKKKTEIHIQDLENKLIEMYYPSNLVSTMKTYLDEGNRNVEEVIQRMVEETYSVLDLNLMKTAFVLEQVYQDLYIYFCECYSWIEQFIDIQPYSVVHLTPCDGVQSMQEKMVENIKELLDYSNKLIFRSKGNSLILEVCQYIVDHVEAEISMDDISKVLFLSKNYIGDTFKKETGITVKNYITMVKMERAKYLIAKEDLKSYEIADRLGYNQVEYFGKVFKKYIGLTPLELKNSLS